MASSVIVSQEPSLMTLEIGSLAGGGPKNNAEKIKLPSAVEMVKAARVVNLSFPKTLSD